MEREIIYLGRSNSVDFILKSQSATSTSSSAADLSGIDRVTLTIGSCAITSSNVAGQMIRWAQAGYVTGEVRISLGTIVTMATGFYDAPLVVYDAGDTSLGLMWGKIPLRIKKDPEGSTT